MSELRAPSRGCLLSGCIVHVLYAATAGTDDVGTAKGLQHALHQPAALMGCYGYLGML